MSKTVKILLIVSGFLTAIGVGFGVSFWLSQSFEKVANNVSVVKPKNNNSVQTTPAIPAEKHAAGETFSTYIEGETGKIAVSVVLPKDERFASGAPVVVYVPVFFTPDISNFSYLAGLEEQGIIQATFMYPGRKDKSGVASEGENDYGGANSIKALRDVILFAAGEKANIDGYFLSDLTEIKPEFGNVGLYAFSHPGIIATNVMALYGDQLSKVDFLVGRENPTEDLILSMEIGYYNDNKTVVQNSIYSYPVNYSPTNIAIDYSSVKWSTNLNLPYFDFNNDNQPNALDYIFGKQVPQMFGKRVYSNELLLALKNNGLNETAWPKDLATPEEAESWLADNRETVNSYSKLLNLNLKVMLVFNVADHVQTALDKPHIHQAYDGFHNTAGLWVRLNPDYSYVNSLSTELGKTYNEHPADSEPTDWLEIGDWAYQSKVGNTLVPLAAVMEMVDRTQANNWQDNLSEIIK